MRIMAPLVRLVHNLLLRFSHSSLTSPSRIPLSAPRQPVECLKVLRWGLGDDLIRERRTRRAFVPTEGLQVIPDKLLVEARLWLPGSVAVNGPKTSGRRSVSVITFLTSLSLGVAWSSAAHSERLVDRHHDRERGDRD